MSNIAKFKQSIKTNIIDIKKSLIWIESFDFRYMLDIIKSAVGPDCLGLVWRASDNAVLDLYDETKHVKLSKDPSDINLGGYIYSFSKYKEANRKLFIAQIPDDFIERNPILIPCLQNFVYKNDALGDNLKKTVILISNNQSHISGLDHICEYLEMPLPDMEDIYDIIGWDDKEKCLKTNQTFNFASNFTYQNTSGGSQVKDERQHARQIKNFRDLANVLLGMHKYDIVNLLYSIQKTDKYHQIQLYDYNGTYLLDTIKKRKKQLVKNTGLLEVVDVDADYDKHIADIENLIDHVKKEEVLIQDEDFQNSELPKPRGVLLGGDPGCGKSESAKAIASILKLPLYRLNIGDLLGHKYGQSENRFSEALRTADASAPCVLWIDEIEKAFAGAGNEKENDDTLTHIIGRFLTWMQEHQTMVYLVATANDISKMRPEMLRKGRWDEKFYLVYPSPEGRSNILDVTLERYHFSPLHLGKDSDIIRKMDGLSGAEIANIVVEVAKEKYRSAKQPSNSPSLKVSGELKAMHSSKKIGISVTITENDLEKHLDSKVFLSSRNEEKNIEEKINEEIREMRIRYMGRRIEKSEVEELRKLLRQKYEAESSSRARFEAQGFKAASKFK